MTNKGLEKAFIDEGIELVRSDVGDKYVLEKLNDTPNSLNDIIISK